MRAGGLRLAFFLAALLAAAPPLAGAELFPIYQKYQKAIADGDAAGAKFFLSRGRRAQLSALSNDAALAEMNVLSPKDNLRLHEEIIEGDDATLIVRADVDESEPTGRLQFVREQGTWKILSEMWEFGGEPEDAPLNEVRQPENEQQREALRQLREMGFPQPTADFLVMSAVEGKLEAVKLFLAAGYSPDTENQGSPAIVSAAMFGHPEVVLYLIGAGANVNGMDGANTTALMRMADKCDTTPALKALLKAGARTDIKSAGGATAAQLAEWAGCADNLAVIRAAARN